MIKNRSDVVASLAVVLCGLLWGLYWYPLRSVAAAGVGAAWTSLIFNGVSSLACLPWLLKAETRRDIKGAVLLTGVLTGGGFTLYTISLQLADVVHVILLFYLTPVWSVVIGRMFYGQELTVARIVALALGLLGMGLLLGVGGTIPLPHNAGEWIALASGFLWALGTLRSSQQPQGKTAVSVFAFSTMGFVSSALVLLLAGSMGSPLAQMDGLAAQFLWIVVVALVFFVPPNFLVLWAAQRLASARVGILLMGEVVVGALSAAVLAGGTFSPQEALGAVLIVSAGLVEVLGRG